MDASDGRLKILDLSKEQLLRLFNLSMSIFPIIQHDMGGALASVRAELYFLQEDLKDLGGEFASLEEPISRATPRNWRGRQDCCAAL